MKYLLILTGLLLFFFQGFSQEAESQKEKLKMLDFLLGNWKVEVDARLSMQGPWEKSVGKSTVRKTLDSMLIEEEFTGTRQGKIFLSKTFFATNNMTNKYQRLFIDAPHGVFVDFEGIRTADSLVFDKNFVYSNGNVVKLRTVYIRLSDTVFIVESMRMPQTSTTWDITGKMKYTKNQADQ